MVDFKKLLEKERLTKQYFELRYELDREAFEVTIEFNEAGWFALSFGEWK